MVEPQLVFRRGKRYGDRTPLRVPNVFQNLFAQCPLGELLKSVFQPLQIFSTTEILAPEAERITE